MSHRLGRMMRRFSPVLGAGILLQAGSCSFNFNELGASLTAAIVNELITDFVFGVFNVGAF